MRPSILLAACALLIRAVALAEVTRPCDVPTSLMRALEKALPGFRLMTHADLTQEDRRFFVRDHPNACPGHALVDFYGDRRPATALSLRSREKAVLVLARPDSAGTWSLRVLDEANEPGVVWKEEPGEYEDLQGSRRLRLSREGVVWCGYESWAILYGWVDGRVEKIWVAD